MSVCGPLCREGFCAPPFAGGTVAVPCGTFTILVLHPPRSGVSLPLSVTTVKLLGIPPQILLYGFWVIGTSWRQVRHAGACNPLPRPQTVAGPRFRTNASGSGCSIGCSRSSPTLALISPQHLSRSPASIECTLPSRLGLSTLRGNLLMSPTTPRACTRGASVIMPPCASPCPSGTPFHATSGPSQETSLSIRGSMKFTAP
jgi:hypothetical protein